MYLSRGGQRCPPFFVAYPFSPYREGGLLQPPSVSKLRFRYHPSDREIIAYTDVVYVDEFNCQGGTMLTCYNRRNRGISNVGAILFGAGR
jgi:hypothetical protein